MRRFVSRRPSPAMAIAFVALLAALSGTAIALPGANTVDGGDIRTGAVKSKDIENGAVETRDIKNNDVRSRDVRNSTLRGADVRNDSLTGADVDESRLGQVSSASSATTANTANRANTAATANRAISAGSVDGRMPFRLMLGAGQSRTIARNGAISLVAECNSAGGTDQARIVAATSSDGAILQGYEDDATGPGDGSDFLDSTTLADDREFVEVSDAAGDVNFEDDIDSGYVIAPDGKVLTLGSETTALGLNFAGAKCFFAGVVDAIG
jgi:hypothetical protein